MERSMLGTAIELMLSDRVNQLQKENERYSEYTKRLCENLGEVVKENATLKAENERLKRIQAEAFVRVAQVKAENDEMESMHTESESRWRDENARLLSALERIKRVVEESADSCGLTCMESSIHEICTQSLEQRKGEKS